MLKQARAFGVGLVLATQNPIDLDYKALSNAGTWMIGKLQTDQDKQRLLDGLEGLTGGLDRAYFDKTISELGKRVFLLHNAFKGPGGLYNALGDELPNRAYYTRQACRIERFSRGGQQWKVCKGSQGGCYRGI